MIIRDTNNLKREVVPNLRGNIAERAAYYFSKISNHKYTEDYYLLRLFTKDIDFFNALKVVTPHIEKEIHQSQIKKGKLKMQDYLVNLCRLPTSCFIDIEATKIAESGKKVERPTLVAEARSAKKSADRSKHKLNIEGEEKISSKPTRTAPILSEFSRLQRNLSNKRREGYGTTILQSEAEKGLIALKTKYKGISDETFNNYFKTIYGGMTKMMLAICWVSDLNNVNNYQHGKRKGTGEVYEPQSKIFKLNNYTAEEQRWIFEYHKHCQSKTYRAGTICPIPSKLAEFVKTDLTSQPAYFNSFLGDMPSIPCSQWFNMKLTLTGDLSLIFKEYSKIKAIINNFSAPVVTRSSDAWGAHQLGLFAAPAAVSRRTAIASRPLLPITPLSPSSKARAKGIILFKFPAFIGHPDAPRDGDRVEYLPRPSLHITIP